MEGECSLDPLGGRVAARVVTKGGFAVPSCAHVHEGRGGLLDPTCAGLNSWLGRAASARHGGARRAGP